ncbi:MAG: OmpA family protein [Bacteroidia bacterium]|jgi:chemotaxis protein MotB|nr:OmpA family protein [Bacteroidia bacterium]
MRILLLLTILIGFSSCVSKRKYDDMYALWVYTDSEYRLLKNKNQQHDNRLQYLLGVIDRLKRDSAFIDSVCRASLNSSDAEKVRLEAERKRLKDELLSQAGKLKLSANKISELEAMLYRKDSMMRATRNMLQNALLGFKDKGVTVKVIGGKVYISLDERLLFQSGKIDVNPEGRIALVEIANALNSDTTTILTVEGHTDDIPYRGKAFKDNWDISVLRATSVIRLMSTTGGIAPNRFIASGRAEYFPLDNEKTAEARRKNRRIEIIVTPNLDELAALLESE